MRFLKKLQIKFITYKLIHKDYYMSDIIWINYNNYVNKVYKGKSLKKINNNNLNSI
jgi:hypothetical protein